MSNDTYFDIPYEITNPLEQRIAEVFLAYDHNAVNIIDKSDVGTVLRCLGCVPTMKDVNDIVEKSEFPSHPGEIHITKFMTHVKGLLFRGKMKPSSPEELLQAFKVLDEPNKGFFEKDEFRKMMTDFGEEMKEEELEKFMKSATDPIDNRVYYETYIARLMHEPEDSIYRLAEKYVNPGSRASQKRFSVLFGKKP